MYLFKVLAYKDEYEVARLSLRPELDAALRAQFPDGGRVRYRLHPPILRALGMHRKVAVGGRFRPAFRGLRAMRRVRGTPFDPFGYTKVRRAERSLARDYRALVDQVLARSTPRTVRACGLDRGSCRTSSAATSRSSWRASSASAPKPTGFSHDASLTVATRVQQRISRSPVNGGRPGR